MFEITGDDISLLNDTDLRALIGRLCEAELRRQGHSVSYVTWGGSQTAKDGGLDVHVALPAGASISGFIPRPETGFQVKKPDMPRKEILDEMKPGGVLRPVIVDLAKESGAYIIVSSTGSTAFSALKSRKKAMADAVDGIADASKLALDFYDRNRVATWLRDHPGLIPWVRSLIGKSIPGWQSFGSWSRAPGGVDDSYLFDDDARIKTGDKDEGDGFSAVDGINRIRDVLRQPGQVVRLVGLSGVGKTRLCEALFDTSIGKDGLDPSLAYYTNVAEDPKPPPIGLASDLISAGRRGILVIDNCPFALHGELAKVAHGTNSTISVITVEYDIRDDQPEGTDVFALDSSSLTLIEKLVARRYPNISQIDARTIAEFSGGNARVALALAATVGKNETIAGLSDADLFERLFQQRHEHDPDLLLIAQACSLVYSFEGVKTEGDGAELPILAGLIGKSVLEVYRAVGELKRRDLLQERAEWRAVLPHAIANRLAALALQNIPVPSIMGALVNNNASQRLRRSFSRRLGYLDGSKEAQAIVQAWLAPGGMLADIPNLREDERTILANVAPVMPDETLAAIEHAVKNADEGTLAKSTHVVRLLRSLAYEPEQFERAIALLIKFACAADSDESSENAAASIVPSLFYIVLSGTHAPIAMRLKVLEGLLKSDDPARRALGVKSLDAILTTDHFSSAHSFEFGARSRDYGYHPPTGKDVQDWFGAVLQVATPLALSSDPVAAEVRSSIARAFRGLWSNTGQVDALEGLVTEIGTREFWREGWGAVRQARIFDGEHMPEDIRKRLAAMEELLRPKDLIDQVKGVVLGSGRGNVDIDDLDEVENDDYAGAMARMNQTVENLGKDVANDDEAFEKLLPGLVRGGSRVGLFGHGLASSTEKPYEIWQAFVTEFSTAKETDTGVMAGFLIGLQKRDPALADKMLDEALGDPAIGPRFPQLQASVTIDALGIARLNKALKLDLAPIHQFQTLAYGRAADAMPGPEFRDLLLAIAKKQGGLTVALEILSMRLFSDAADKRTPVPEVAEAGRVLLDAYEFHKKDRSTDREDRELGRIAQLSLAGEEGIPIVQRIIRKMMAAIDRYEIHAYDQDDLMAGLLAVHPAVVLDEAFAGDAKARGKAVQAFGDFQRFRKNPLSVVPDDVLLAWCDVDPDVRYPIMAASAGLFQRPANSEPHDWLPLVSKLLAKAPDPVAVLKEIVKRVRPWSWSGSLATKLEGRLKLLERLPINQTPALVDELNAAKASLQEWIATERKNEAAESRARSGRFED
ncbi:hypothetical protein ACFQZO_32315 [Bradyrhizobium sp. GCM10027634]|uniref:hypothetical protein n=1 Tax=unclassified Bradyrhizobium TaxID=2631580 RepID=UPI00263B52EC|nr:hypothetical protein [Bradyrhizobium sp. WYCCWR 12677]MDN5005545.1 hypothetical protein [Bradyrhizobium sp. WYCCWR 12677]